jgi:general secretion pathway protein A
MYESFYHLKEKPFRIVPNPDYLYLSSKHENALTYLEYGIMEDVGFVLLTGEIGTGKTTLIRHILNGLESDIQVAVVFNTNVTAEQLLDLILGSFELSVEQGGKARALDVIYQYLIRQYAANKRVLLIIDEAQNLSDEAMEEVRMLSNLQSDDQILLQIMLVGQPELQKRLRQPGLSSLTQRIAVQYHLAPLATDEVKQYIAYRMEKAGGTAGIFEPAALDLIARTTGGIPRAINLLCDAALVYGFGYELKTIGVPVIEQVIKDKGGLGLITEQGEDACETESGDDRVGGHLSQRLEALEAKLQRLHVQVEWQTREVERRGEGFKDELVTSLNRLLKTERTKHEALLAKHARLAERYQTLKANGNGRETQQSSTDAALEAKFERLQHKYTHLLAEFKALHEGVSNQSKDKSGGLRFLLRRRDPEKP